MSGKASSGAGGPPVDAGAVSAACKAYCTAVDGACTAAADMQYASAAECESACAILEVSPMATGMDTIACRTTHAGYATATPYPHCWHAGPYGYGTCGDECQAFCILADNVCPGTYNGCVGRCAMFTKVAAPANAAAAANAYSTSGPTTGNTLDCREYYLGLALQGLDKAANCSNAGDMSPKCK